MQFMLGRKDLGPLLAKIRQAEVAPKLALRSKQTRMEILAATSRDVPCVCDAPGQWLQAAEQVVVLNGYGAKEVQSAILQCLQHCRAKGRTVFIVGGNKPSQDLRVAALHSDLPNIHSSRLWIPPAGGHPGLRVGVAE